MSDSISLKGREYAEKLSSAPALDAYTGVSIYVGQDQDGDPVYYNAGNDTGSVLEFENPWGTQAMANQILSKIQGRSYQPLEMRKTIVDPAVELGDMIDLTDEGISAMVLDRVIDFGAGMVNDISAPYSQEIDHEYQYTPSEERMLNRKIATTVASIRVDVDAIELEVSGKIDSIQATSLIRQTMNNITLSVSSGTQSNTTKFTLTGTGISAVSDNITLNANSINLNTATISGKLTASNINANNITATGVNITGELNATSGSMGNCTIKKSCTLLSDAAGNDFDFDTGNIMWIGSHTLSGAVPVETTTKIVGSYMQWAKSTSQEWTGISFSSYYQPNGASGVQQNAHTVMSSLGFNTTIYDDTYIPLGELSLSLLTGIYLWYRNTQISMTANQITFTNSTGSCTLDDILDAIDASGGHAGRF